VIPVGPAGWFPGPQIEVINVQCFGKVVRLFERDEGIKSLKYSNKLGKYSTRVMFYFKRKFCMIVLEK
jgi:hypothetical protein